MKLLGEAVMMQLTLGLLSDFITQYCAKFPGSPCIADRAFFCLQDACCELLPFAPKMDEIRLNYMLKLSKKHPPAVKPVSMLLSRAAGMRGHRMLASTRRVMTGR